MIINEPYISIDVSTTTEEDDIIDECIGILENILNIMNKYHCEEVDYGYPGEPCYIHEREIRSIKTTLFNIKDIHTMC